MNDLFYHLVAGSESTFPVDVANVGRTFAEKIRTFLPDNPVQFTSLEEVRQGLHEKVEEAIDTLDGGVVVTLSSLYYPYTPHEISCNRIVDQEGTMLGLGQRPGSTPLAEQVVHVQQLVQDQNVVLVDDTLFHGDTVRHIMEMGLQVDAIVEFFTAKQAAEKLHDEGVLVLSAHTLEGYKDVLPVHDFIPFAPLCGKVIGRLHHDTCEPVYLNGRGEISLSLPYLMPFVTSEVLESWASIPAEHGLEFSHFALEQSMHLAELLEDHGFGTVGEATGNHSYRTSFPYHEDMKFSHQEPLTRFIRRALHLLEG